MTTHAEGVGQAGEWGAWRRVMPLPSTPSHMVWYRNHWGWGGGGIGCRKKVYSNRMLHLAQPWGYNSISTVVVMHVVLLTAFTFRSQVMLQALLSSMLTRAVQQC